MAPRDEYHCPIKVAVTPRTLTSRFGSTIRRWTLAASVGAVPAIMLAACTASDGGPGATGTPTGSVTPSPSPTTSFQAAGKSWSTFDDGWLEPLAPALTWGLGLAAILVVGARLLVPIKRWNKTTTTSRGLRTKLGSWAIPLVILFSLATPVLVAFSDEKRALWPFVVVALFFALIAAAWCWWWLGTRPRVAIRVTDAKGEASVPKSALLTHLIDDLGASPPHGIKATSATDLEELAKATSKVSENAFLASIVSILEFVGNTAPWQVEVQELPDRRALVDVRWNGDLIASEPIDAKELRLPGPEKAPDAVERMAAAVVALAMVKHYDDWTGLYQATKWKSVGFHHVARGLLADSDEKPKPLYERAVAADEWNALARASLNNEIYAEKTTTDQLDRYLTFLRTSADKLAPDAHRHPPFSSSREKAGTRDRDPDIDVNAPRMSGMQKHHETPTTLLIRTLLVWALTVRNRIAIEDANNGKASPRPDPAEVTALWALVRLVAEACRGLRELPDDRLLHRMRAATAVSIRRLHDSGVYGSSLEELVSHREVGKWFDEAKASGEPAIAYGYACYLAMRRDATLSNSAGEPPDRTISEKLKIGLSEPSYVAWAPLDPELYRLRDDYWGILHPDRPTHSMDVAPLKSHKQALRDIGIRSPKELLGASSGVRSHIGVDPEEYRRIRAVAALAARLESRTGQRLQTRVPLFLHLLVTNHVDSVTALRKATDDELLKALGDAVRGVKRGRKSGYLSEREAVCRIARAWRS